MPTTTPPTAAEDAGSSLPPIIQAIAAFYGNAAEDWTEAAPIKTDGLGWTYALKTDPTMAGPVFLYVLDQHVETLHFSPGCGTPARLVGRGDAEQGTFALTDMIPRPIASAPRDGTLVTARSPAGTVRSVYWSPDKQTWATGPDFTLRNAVEWVPHDAPHPSAWLAAPAADGAHASS